VKRLTPIRSATSSSRQRAPQPGGTDVAAQPLQGLLQSCWGVLNDGTELGQAGKRQARLSDGSINGSWVA